ncbi:MAG: hypothetical protein AAGE59_03560 [Cyanobacteria bacterium P01_F01_bin.86]
MQIVIVQLATLLMVCLMYFSQPAIAHADTMTDQSTIQGTNTIHHLVSTHNPLAQTLFDKGLQSFFSYDLEKAQNFFQQAIEQDSELAMAYWGLALASSPDINQSIDLEQEADAYAWARKALDLTANSGVSIQEKAYIRALQKRYSLDPNEDFRRLMENYCASLSEFIQQYPKDPDIATLYAEGLMDLQGWNFWDDDKEPLGNTLEILSILNFVLETYPNHLGANHYYVHVMEGSGNRELTLLHAKKLLPYTSTSEHLQAFTDYIIPM